VVSPLLRAAGGGFWWCHTCEEQEEAVLVVSHLLRATLPCSGQQEAVVEEAHLLRTPRGGFGGDTLAKISRRRVWCLCTC
jgi:hypothetical protein